MIRILSLIAAAAIVGMAPIAVHAQTPPAMAPAAVGTVAHNEWLARTFIDRALNQPVKAERDKVFAQLVAMDYVNHNPFVPPGLPGLSGYFDNLFSSFSAAKFDIQDVITTKDKVIIRSVFSASLTGPNMTGLAPKSQKIQIGVIDIWSIRDGKLYEHWDQIDWTGFLAQSGVAGLPAPFYAVAGVTPPGVSR